MQKSLLRDAILKQLREELARQSSAAELSRDEAISEESRAENKWDTHSQEAAYLAEGQAKLAQEVVNNIDLYGAMTLPIFGPGEPAALGAIVQLGPVGGGARGTGWDFIGPRAGGLELEIEGRTILVVTPQSPLGRQLLGKKVGEMVSVPGRGSLAKQLIVSVE